MDVAARDRRYVARAEPPDGVQMAQSEERFVFDHLGKTYDDFTAGSCVGNLGRGNDEMCAAIGDFDGPTYVHPELSNHAPSVVLTVTRHILGMRASPPLAARFRREAFSIIKGVISCCWNESDNCTETNRSLVGESRCWRPTDSRWSSSPSPPPP